MAEEFDYTAAVEAAAKTWWNEHGTVFIGEDTTPVDWDLIPGGIKAQIRIGLLETVVAAVDTVFEQKEFEGIMNDG